jgi:cytidylate kinase
MAARAVLDAGQDPRDDAAAIAAARSLDPSRYRDEDLRSEAVGDAASIVAVVQQVRAALLGFQRDFAQQLPGAVLDGREIGTVVCPKADVKIFVTASPQVRARRRAEELAERGLREDYAQVLADIRARDERDRSRPNAPLVAASDAFVLDTSDLDIAAATAIAVDLVMRKQAALRNH